MTTRRDRRSAWQVVGTTVVTAAVSVAPLTTARGDAASAPVPDSSPGWVTGVVVDANGDPVAGAMVNVLPPREIPETGVSDVDSDRTTTTDAEGRFRVRQAPHRFLVQVCDVDEDRPWACARLDVADYLLQYVGPDGGFDSWIEHTRLYRSSTADLLLGTVEVRPGTRIHGTLAGAVREQVRVMRLNDTMAYSTFTDADGRYSVNGLAPGTYYVAAGGLGSLPWRSQPVTVDALRPARVDGRLDLGASAVGQVVHARTGAPVRRTEIFLARARSGLVASLLTTRSGSFQFTGLTPGRYRVGTLVPGGVYLRHAERFEVTEPDGSVRVEVPVRRGASVTVPLRGGPLRGDELRDSRGNVIQYLRAGDGAVTYTGLRRGSYTVVASDEDGYGMRTFEVRTLQPRTLRPLALDRKFLRLRGRTAPGAVVEATTGDLCPPDVPERWAGYHEIAGRADADGRYVLRRLVPGRHMVAADAWPHNYAARCHEDVVITRSRRFDVPLVPGHTVSGRLVYEGTGRPAITTLAYEVRYPAGQDTNPTREHPSRDRAQGATGRFAITRVPAGPATVGLATTASDEVGEHELRVLYPFQDGTPYWLETAPQSLAVQGDVDLGDIELRLAGTAAGHVPSIEGQP